VKLTSDFALLSIKNDRAKLAKHFQVRPASGPCPDELRIPITLTGYISGVWGQDDGTDQEFTVAVTSLRPNLKTGSACRTAAGETLFNMPVAAYMQDTEFGGVFATHWSTIPKHHDPIRLFSEGEVQGQIVALWDEFGSTLALLGHEDVSPQGRNMIREALERVTGTKAPEYLGGAPR
jgi:hypothetical protein